MGAVTPAAIVTTPTTPIHARRGGSCVGRGSTALVTVTPVPTPQARPRRRLPSVEETSAGGVVVDRGQHGPRVAVIARRNRAGRVEWCLPKGHPEGSESLEEAAVREVAEETGIRGRVLAPLGTIDYWFSVADKRIHKVVHHYLMEAVGGRLTIEDDPDAEAIDVAWVPVAELDDRLSFANERRIAEAAADRLADIA
jgi:8-oxo-dGTP pyrophosphatase MutT (NUDIX family)